MHFRGVIAQNILPLGGLPSENILIRGGHTIKVFMSDLYINCLQNWSECAICEIMSVY